MCVYNIIYDLQPNTDVLRRIEYTLTNDICNLASYMYQEMCFSFSLVYD